MKLETIQLNQNLQKIEAIKKIPSPKDKTRCYAIPRNHKFLFQIYQKITYKPQTSI